MSYIQKRETKNLGCYNIGICKIVCFIMIVIFYTASLCAQNIKPVFLVGEWPPFCSQKQENFGMLNEIVTAAFKEVGIEIEYEWMPWSGALELAKAGKEYCGSIGWAKDDYKLKHFNYSEDGLCQTIHGFLHRKDFKFDWETVDDLKGLTIGHTRGYTYMGVVADYKDKGIFNIELVDTDEINLTKLINKRIDLFDTNIIVSEHLLKSKFPAEQSMQITHHPKLTTDEYLYLIISKKYPESEFLLDQFNKGFSIIKQNGIYDKIVEKY